MFRQLRRRRGFTTAEVLVVTGILAALGGDSFTNCTNKAHQTACFNQLRQIGMAFMMRAQMDEALPRAWFYPPDNHPARETYNLARLMARDGVPASFFICPGAPDELKQRGICYLYNDKLSDRNLDSIQDPASTWLMMDVNGINQEITPAHNGGCNVLFCDGHVKWLPSTAIPNMMTQAVDFQGE